MKRQRSLWDKIWKNNRGEVVIYQRPNLPLIGRMVLTAGSLFLDGRPADVAWYAGLLSLAVWAGLELLQGVNYFRRALGGVVAVAIVVMAARLL